MDSILIVEPDLTTSDAWATAISASGHSVLIASGTREALQLVREGGIDVVVVDVYEPCTSVIELARAMDALPDAPPILLISSCPAAPKISARIGVAMFLPKPCEPSELVTAVGQLLRRSRPVWIMEDELTNPTRQSG